MGELIAKCCAQCHYVFWYMKCAAVHSGQDVLFTCMYVYNMLFQHCEGNALNTTNLIAELVCLTIRTLLVHLQHPELDAPCSDHNSLAPKVQGEGQAEGSG